MQSTPPLTRPRDGRVLGGVCAGLAAARGLPVGAVRVAFAAAALVAGIGVVAYVACWLIVPGEDERGGRTIVALVLAGAGALGLATLAALGAAATIFGFGWAVVAIAAVALVAGLASWRRLGPGWALLPVAALVLPSVAVAAAGVQVAPQTSDQVFAPATAADVAPTYRSGLGYMLVDLRRTALPAHGEVRIRIEGGLRRTIVALPHDRCVSTSVEYDVRSFAARAAAVLLGRPYPLSDDVVLYGQPLYGRRGGMAVGNGGRGPRVHLDFSSAGGGLSVRDYPDDVDPRSVPGWPLDPGYAPSMPDTTGLGAKARKRVRAKWLPRHRANVAARARYRKDLAGPCLADGAGA